MNDLPLSVLYADDDEDDVMLFNEALQLFTMPTSLVVAPNGKDALQLLQGKPFDIIFLDFNMPVMDGLSCLRAIRSTPSVSHLPVILLSTCGDILTDALKSGASCCFKKPIKQVNWNHILSESFSFCENFRLRE